MESKWKKKNVLVRKMMAIKFHFFVNKKNRKTKGGISQSKTEAISILKILKQFMNSQKIQKVYEKRLLAIILGK